MREMSVAEQRYKAVLAVIGDGRTVTEVAASWEVSRQTLHTWLARYEDGGLEALADRSHRPRSCPHQMDASCEVAVLEARRRHPGWGPRRIVHELAKAGITASESGVYRALRRAGLIEPGRRRREQRDWKRWERARPNELWQLDVVGGIMLADGTAIKCLTGVDDHSRFCVSAALMVKERTQAVCDALERALATHGVPEQILTDNGKVFTGRYNNPPTEVLFDRICRVNGIEHLLTKPRSPTTTGKIERFHRSLRTEFLTDTTFESLAAAQERLDAWVSTYNTDRPHQSLDMHTPAERYGTGPRRQITTTPDRTGPEWVARKVSTVGVVCVSWQQVSVGRHRAGERCDVHVGDDILQLWIGNELLRTVQRNSTGPIRNKRPLGGALTKSRTTRQTER
jgi:transposase InsO family protein